MKAPVYAKHGLRRQIIDTGHKTFDRQTSAISPGNVIGGTMVGTYVRGELDEGKGLVDYPANKRAPGVLRDFDLRGWNDMPREMRDAVMAATAGTAKPVILYVFFHRRNGRTINDGWLLTTTGDSPETIKKVYARWTSKCAGIVEECEKYLTGDRAPRSAALANLS